MEKLLIQPYWIDTGRAKATADPSTSLRFAQDDSSVVMQSLGAGSIESMYPDEAS
jgi:hypothetical protein